MRPAYCLAICFLVVAMFCSGCSNEKKETDGGSAKMIQACDLLTRAEIEQIVGAPFGDPNNTDRSDPASSHWMSMCNYYSDQKNLSVGVTLVPSSEPSDTAKAFEQYKAELKAQLGDDYTIQTVEGVGEHAGWNEDAKQLTLFAGPYMIIVGVQNRDLFGSNALDFTRRLAEDILPKLSK